jgi:hypothetical protein
MGHGPLPSLEYPDFCLICRLMSSDPKKSELFNLTVLDLPDQTELVKY